jgi:hypothetical protein
MGLQIKEPMVLHVDNQHVRELVNNWSMGSQTRHVATKAMFLHVLKEWGLLVIEYLEGIKMCADLLTKNLPGPLFNKHLGFFVTDKVLNKADIHQARESAGINI